MHENIYENITKTKTEKMFTGKRKYVGVAPNRMNNVFNILCAERVAFYIFT